MLIDKKLTEKGVKGAESLARGWIAPCI